MELTGTSCLTTGLPHCLSVLLEGPHPGYWSGSVSKRGCRQLLALFKWWGSDVHARCRPRIQTAGVLTPPPRCPLGHMGFNCLPWGKLNSSSGRKKTEVHLLMFTVWKLIIHHLFVLMLRQLSTMQTVNHNIRLSPVLSISQTGSLTVIDLF